MLTVSRKLRLYIVWKVLETAFPSLAKNIFGEKNPKHMYNAIKASKLFNQNHAPEIFLIKLKTEPFVREAFRISTIILSDFRYNLRKSNEWMHILSVKNMFFFPLETGIGLLW